MQEGPDIGNTVAAWSEMSVNLPENSDSEQQQHILDALPVMVFLESGGRIVFANAEARRLLGTDDLEQISKPVEEILWGFFSGIAEPQTSLAGGENGSPFHATMESVDGALIPVEGIYSILNAELREGIVVAHAKERERTPRVHVMEDVLASIPEAVAILHGDAVLYTNPAFTRMFGYTSEEVSGRNLRDFIVPETRQRENATLKQLVDQNGRALFETVRMNKDGDFVDVALHAAPLLVNGDRAGYVLTYRDIGDRKQVEARLQHDAMHDALTGLPNRALFIDRLSLALNRRQRRREQSCGVLFLDLDRFKEINDTLGHAAGDELLIAVAERLSTTLRPQDTAARLGGDEFAVLLDNILSVSDLDMVASRIVHALDRPFEIHGNELYVVASIGAVVAGPNHTSPELLIRDADFAMYRAKQEGGNRFEIFDRQMEVHVSRQQERERALRQVLDKRDFELWYQPIYRLANGKLEGFEGLLRWRRPDGSMESIRDLLPAADDAGLSIGISRETVDAACRQLKVWDDTIAGSALTLTVNVSQRQFYHDELVSQVQRTLARTQIDPSRLMFEVSENTLNGNPDAALAILQTLVDCGVRVALDNFGSSLAPLNHILRLPIDVVKMDPALTASAMAVGRQRALVESLIHVGKSVGAQVLAQGIETAEQLMVFRRLGCELGQGYLLSRAIDPERTVAVVERGYWQLNSN
jgi:diguanylate cyclase (GGDEF)-like protein/PAS domain S-box-containing protein